MKKKLTSKKIKIIRTCLKKVFILENLKVIDERGYLVKTFSKPNFKKLNLLTNFKESLYTFSKKNVIRGMHYHGSHSKNAKLISVVQGKILDVVLDISRKKTFFFSTVLSDKNCRSLYVPEGFAHGFLCLSKTAIVSYQLTSVFKKTYDKGIAYNSFGFKWPVNKPIISKKDMLLPKFYEL